MSGGLNRAGTVIFWTVRILATLLVIAVPILGVWVGSSLAAYLNGPVWAVCLAGLLLFPVLPVVWAGWAERKRRQKGRDRRILTFWDQVFVRTFVINGLFLGVLLWASPQTAFTAVSSRGDWMLEGLSGDTARRVRDWLHETADRFDWLYESSHDNEYEELVDVDSDAPRPDPSQQTDEDDPWKDPFARQPEPLPQPDAEPEPLPPGAWPQPAVLHEAVASMPAEAKSSVESVGRFIASHESDPYARVKAIHDFVADHVAYDAPALVAGRYPPQDADTVLRGGVGVCAGYANLMKAIADVTGDEIVIVVGDSRGRGGAISGGGHAWNAARIEGSWYLLDATWDAGHVDGATFTKEYSTGYLFVPPGIMGITHFPEDPVWQLQAEPLTRGDFVRQPMMRPEFFAHGLQLKSPNRSQITVDDEVAIEIGNPHGTYLMATWASDAGRTGECEVERGPASEIRCAFAADGTYHVTLFASPREFGSYPMVGELEVNAR